MVASRCPCPIVSGRLHEPFDLALSGDQVGAWSYALVGFIGWGIKEAGIIAIVLSALWLANSLWLGKRQETLAEQQADAERNTAEATATA
jgi:AAA family ATP:ADP antiporter